MKTHIPALLLAIATLSLSACAKKEKPAENPASGPPSSPGSILDTVKQTADQANDRTRQMAEDIEKVAE